MTLIETVKLPATPERAWELLAVRGGALRLTPGLSVAAGGRGTLRIVVDGHSVTYRGYARQHVEEEGRHLTWTLSGKEVRGMGRAHAEVRARFRADADGATDLRLTVLVEGRGRLGEAEEAEVDRAVSSVIGRFRRMVAKELEESAPAKPTPAEPAAPRPLPVTTRRPPTRVEVVPPAATLPKRGLSAGAAAGALLLGAVALLLWRRRKRR